MPYFWEEEKEPWWLCDECRRFWQEWGGISKEELNKCGNCRRNFNGDHR